MKACLIAGLIMMAFCLGVSAQTGPGGVGTNNGTSFLKSWLDADFNVYQDIAGTQNAANGNRIRNWSDRSGNGVTATIGNDNSRPTFSTLNPFFNSRSAFRFTRSNGAADELNRLVTNKFHVSNDMTIYCLLRSLTPGGGTNNPITSNGVDPNHLYFGGGLVDAEVPSIVNDIGLTFTSTSIAGGGGDQPSSTDYTIKTSAALNKDFIAT